MHRTSQPSTFIMCNPIPSNENLPKDLQLDFSKDLLHDNPPSLLIQTQAKETKASYKLMKRFNHHKCNDPTFLIKKNHKTWHG